ncbi:MAG UNVERIFIED_CONTAM: methyltransferase domain-containing protein [Planctomycetaceae bacterium]|jgi:tocopherol O-methyltransferase
MISCSTIEKDVIRRHYDVSTFFYRLLWGRHIHHGLWDGDESPQQAAQQLTERVVREAAIARGSRVLDIGCGMGGSSIYLASALECQVTGVTLSPFQRRWASLAAKFGGTGGRADFLCADAEKVEFPAASADVVWSLECTEHLFDKPAFFRRAAEWLKPGGRMAICVWFAGDDPLTTVQQQLRTESAKASFAPRLEASVSTASG